MFTIFLEFLYLLIVGGVFSILLNLLPVLTLEKIVSLIQEQHSSKRPIKIKPLSILECSRVSYLGWIVFGPILFTRMQNFCAETQYTKKTEFKPITHPVLRLKECHIFSQQQQPCVCNDPRKTSDFCSRPHTTIETGDFNKRSKISLGSLAWL